jgi:hypothetical protein
VDDRRVQTVNATRVRAFVVVATVTALVLLATSYFGTLTSAGRVSALAATLSPCTFPTAMAATNEETAWQLFVAANCAGSGGHVVWEDWVEQGQYYNPPATGANALLLRSRRFHGSVLQHLRQGHMQRGKMTPFAANTGCQKMTAPPQGLIATQICEEVHMNAATTKFITANNLRTNSGQAKAAAAGFVVDFPAPSVEVKVDWIPASDFAKPFSCTAPPKDFRVESVGGTCYAMAGIHIESKLVKNWVWATFEPQSMLTNPGRCKTFGNCVDPWGSVPPTSSGGTTQLSAAATALMKQAGLAPQFANYRLVGVQIDFFNPDKSPSLLGNSVIEGENVGLKAGQSSCIICHSFSAIKNDGTDNGSTLFPPFPATKPYTPPSGWMSRDLVWSLDQAN